MVKKARIQPRGGKVTGAGAGGARGKGKSTSGARGQAAAKPRRRKIA